MSFALGKNMDPEVVTQINTLQTLLDRKREGGYNSEVAAYYFNAKTPWIKLTSAVEFESGSRGDDVRRFFGVDGNQLAQQNVLFNLDPKQAFSDAVLATGGVLPEDITNLPAGSTYSDYYGIRPKPGITGMSIHTHNRFGSLRTATVNFICWDPDQLAIMELLYMRPGYSVILEFGHSVNLQKNKPQEYIDNEPPEGSIEAEYALQNAVGNTDKLITLETADVIADIGEYNVLNTSPGINFFGSESTISTAEDVYKEINKKRKENNYAYDGIYGIIKNFNWSLRPDGGYNCMTSIVSKGELIESLKIDLSVPAEKFEWTAEQALEWAYMNNTTTTQQIISNTAPVLGGSDATADEAFKQELIDEGVFGPFDVDGTARTFRVKGFGTTLRSAAAGPQFIWAQEGKAALISSYNITEPSPNGTMTIPVYTYKWVK